MVAACCVCSRAASWEMWSPCAGATSLDGIWAPLGLPGTPEEGLSFCERGRFTFCACGSPQWLSLVTSLEDSWLLHELLGFEPDLCPLSLAERIPEEQL